MRINYNESAILANACLNATDKSLSASIERLSSGLKINHAKDNPAGLAISNRMNAQIKGLGHATNNTNDGISVVQTADGAMDEITAMIQRMNQLCIQASTDTTTDEDRALINEEVQQLKQEVERIASDTEFNGQKLLDGTFDLKGYTNNKDVKVEYYSDEVKAGQYQIDIDGIVNADGSIDVSKLTGFNVTGLTGTGTEPTADEDGIIKIKGDNNFQMEISYKAGATGTIDVDITGLGAMKIQTGANEGQELAVRIPTISLKKMGISKLDVSTAEGAQAGIASVKEALTYVNDARAKLGAYQNRMEHNTSNLAVSSENMTSSYSRIMDVDMAEEMTEYSTAQVLTQAGISMLAQANERPQQVLQLLQ